MIYILTKDDLNYINGNHNVIDMTLRSFGPYKGLSPFFNWGRIPVPFTHNVFAQSVASIWEALKVFEHADIDAKVFNLTCPRDILRVEEHFGKLIGYRRGVFGSHVYETGEAIPNIFIKSYRWVLEHCASELILYLRDAYQSDLYLYDGYADMRPYVPVSPALLVKAYVEGSEPFSDVKTKRRVYKYYYGKRVICNTEELVEFKPIPVLDKESNQHEIEFDEI